MTPDELKYYIASTLIPGIGSILSKRLIACFGNVKEIFTAKPKDLQKISGIGSLLAHEIITQRQQAMKLAEKELLFIEKNKIQTLCYIDSAYPERLRHCEDGPVVLYVKGNIDFNRAKFLSIVGTRRATKYGQTQCEKIVEQLAERGHNPVIISGLAYGVDVCAHRAALHNKLDTIAVMATGLNMVYPATHTTTAHQIVNQGAVITDFVSSTKLDRKNFLKRNRIIAGLSDATLIVESHIKGGALVTADIAMSYNRDVLAIPGRIGDVASEGCNDLIRRNKAALVETAEHIEYALRWENANKPVVHKQLPLFTNLSEEEQQIISILKESSVESIDSISYLTDIPVGHLSALLLNMEFKDMIKSMPGKQYMIKI